MIIALINWRIVPSEVDAFLYKWKTGLALSNAKGLIGEFLMQAAPSDGFLGGPPPTPPSAPQTGSSPPVLFVIEARTIDPDQRGGVSRVVRTTGRLRGRADAVQT
jgi:hypothetical protein